MKVLYIGTNPVSKHNLRELLAALPGNFEVDLLVRLEEGEIEGRWRPLDPASGGHYWESTIPYVHLAYHEEVVDIELTVVTWQCRDDQRELTSLPGGLWAFRIERRFKYDSLDVRATLLEPVLD